MCKSGTRTLCCWDTPPAVAIELDPDTVPTAHPDPARPDDRFSILSISALLYWTSPLPSLMSLLSPGFGGSAWLTCLSVSVPTYSQVGSSLPPNKKTWGHSDTKTFISLRMFPGESLTWPDRATSSRLTPKCFSLGETLFPGLLFSSSFHFWKKRKSIG